MRNNIPKREWMSLQDIYRIIEEKMTLDREDYEWQSPTSTVPKWKRNVRNVLQYRKKTGAVEWNGSGFYRL
jgi:hypothetical protein